MINPLQAVLADMKMTEQELKDYILSKAVNPLGTGYMISRFVEKGYSFFYNSISMTGYNYMIALRNGTNIIF